MKRLLIFSTLLMSSCGNMDPAMLNAALGALGNNSSGFGPGFGGPSFGGSQLATQLIRAVAMHIAATYKVNSEQKAAAAARGKSAAQKASLRKKMADNKVSEIAVRVPKTKENPAGIAITDKDGNLVTDKVYVPEKGTDLKAGQVVTVGGHKAILDSSMQGF
jgi:type IV secretory pathway TrbL component